MFKGFGYFVTESSQHISEYVPYFRKRPELLERFKLTNRMETMKVTAESQAMSEREIVRLINGGNQIELQRSTEYCLHMIHSIETGLPRRVNVNVKNTGLITNLPYGSCVEVPCFVDWNGVHPCHVGDLPPQCAALNKTNINVHELGVLAAMEKDKELTFQAILLDPLTSAVLTIEDTRNMVNEMFKAEADYLKEFK